MIVYLLFSVNIELSVLLVLIHRVITRFKLKLIFP